MVATEEGWGNVRVYRYDEEHDARAAFDQARCCRVLYNREDIEVDAAGWNGWALTTIRQVVKDAYLVSGNNKWMIATEEGPGNVRQYWYSTEHDARMALDEMWCCRVLFDTRRGTEVEARGWNQVAIMTIRRDIEARGMAPVA